MIIDDIFEPLYGKFCWDARKGFGSFLTFQFGEPQLLVREGYRIKNGVREFRRNPSVYGDWFLWIYMCDWIIITHGNEIARSSSRTREIERAMKRLNGQSLLKVKVTKEAQTEFSFELGDRLLTSPNTAAYENLSEQWILYEPSAMAFSLRDDLKYSYNPGNIPVEEKDWVPLFTTP